MHPDEQPQDIMQEDQAMHGLCEEYEEWLRDEAAQAEYQLWIASLDSTTIRHDKEQQSAQDIGND